MQNIFSFLKKQKPHQLWHTFEAFVFAKNCINFLKKFLISKYS